MYHNQNHYLKYTEETATAPHRPHSKPQGYAPHAKHHSARYYESRPPIRTQPQQQQYNRAHPARPQDPISTDPKVFQSDGLYFRRLAEKGTCEVAGMASARSARHVSIPSVTSKEGLRVTRIGERAFARSLAMASIDLPASITTIGSHAFASSSLVDIVLDGIQNISECAFEDAKLLKKADLSHSAIKKIPAQCFAGCVSLENIRLPLTLEVVEEQSFYNCYRLRKAWLPPCTREIQANAYTGCTDLNTLVCKSDEVKIHPEAFKNTPKLASFDISLNVRMQAPIVFKDSMSKCTTQHTNGSVVFLENLLRVERVNLRPIQRTFFFIPDDVSIIGTNAFSNIDWGLETLTIPTSVKIIMPGAFAMRTVESQAIIENGIIKDKLVESKTYPKTIRYSGTISEWKKIIRPSANGVCQKALTIHCKDGSITSML